MIYVFKELSFNPSSCLCSSITETSQDRGHTPLHIHKLSQKSKIASSRLQRETREVTQDGVTQLSAVFVFSPQILVFIERKPGILTKITTQTNRKQHIRMPNTQHLLSWAPGWQRRWCLKFYFSNTQDLAVSVSSSLFHVKIKSSYCSFIVKQSSSSPQPKSEPLKIHGCLFSDFLAMCIA